MNNHYVPRFILRNFGDNIPIFDLKEQRISFSGKKMDKAFSKNDIYSDEIEKKLAEKIESGAARIIKNKILNEKDEVVLERHELYTVKKFLLIQTLRTMTSEQIEKSRKDDSMTSFLKLLNFEEKGCHYLSDFDYLMKTLKAVLNSESLMDVFLNNDATFLAVKWSMIFNRAYVAIWDSKDSGEDFLISDIGMVSEHEKTRFEHPFFNDVLKRGYILKSLKNLMKKPKVNKNDIIYFYEIFFIGSELMGENFYAFSISKNRTIVLINPFFALFKPGSHIGNNCPDIWPSKTENRKLFTKNDVEYLKIRSPWELKDKERQDPKELYKYPVAKLNLSDVIYVNSLFLDRASNFLGYSSPWKDS